MTFSSLARDVALAEVGVPWRALRYVRGGFRAAQPAGAFAYDDGGNAPLMLGALAVLAVPEMLILDLVLWHAAAWRIGSDVVHVYLILWALGIAHAFRTMPHELGAERVTLRTLFFASLSVPRTAIVSAEVVELDRRASRRRTRLGLGSPRRLVRVQLREPAMLERWLARPVPVTSVLVAADDPDGLARALNG
ncbi:MAG: hypothetical protein JWN27_206 [Candidatus Eremiobacteraeota bacterium]|nr:hypothetical protein [Candidatus Eremiobacteraeota bacterium]